jgi:hypothetical protein
MRACTRLLKTANNNDDGQWLLSSRVDEEAMGISRERERERERVVWYVCDASVHTHTHTHRGGGGTVFKLLADGINVHTDNAA